jgi:hydrogenase/urease accessory protein HupE
MMRRPLAVTTLVWFALSCTTWAHEIRPAYLQIDQTTPTSYDLLWKLPSNGYSVPDISPKFEAGWTLRELRGETHLDGFVVYRYRLIGEEGSGLPGTRLSIDDLSQTTIDVLVNLTLLDGPKHTFLLHPTSPEVVIPQNPDKWRVAAIYTKLGVEHILLGVDHLLFVLALIILTKGVGKLVKTVTAFTIAHSITLSMAALGFAQVPSRPVEATIALSILFLALEIMRALEGQKTLTSQRPWLIAFSFGLLHGFGFAGALSEIGLPQTEIPLALACFNIGVEAGQLAFIGVILALIRGLNLRPSWPLAVRRIPAYAIGGVSAFWLIDRLHQMVAIS